MMAKAISQSLTTSLVRRDRYPQAGKLRSEFDLAGEARAGIVVGELHQQLALVRHRGWQLFRPFRIDIDVARGARAHSPADRGYTVLQLAQVLHHLRSEEHTSELQSRENLVCRLLLE